MLRVKVQLAHGAVELILPPFVDAVWAKGMTAAEFTTLRFHIGEAYRARGFFKNWVFWKLVGELIYFVLRMSMGCVVVGIYNVD